MSTYRIFAIIITIIGIAGLVFTAALFINNLDVARNRNALVVFGFIAFILFVGGMSWISATKKEFHPLEES